MDPLSVITSVLSAALVVKKWLDDTETKNNLLGSLSITVDRVHDLLSPLSDENIAKDLQSSAISSFRGIGETLSQIKDHLSILREKRVSANRLLVFITPSSVVDKLREDERHLSQQLLIVSVALQISTLHLLIERFRTETSIPNSESPLPNSGPSPPFPEPPRPEYSPLSAIMNAQVREFWRNQIGESVTCTPGRTFCVAISQWLKQDFSEALCDLLLLRLDEFAIGGVTPFSCDRFVGDRTLEEAIVQFRTQGNYTLQPYPPYTRTAAQSCLVWIDDQPLNNKHETYHAKDNGLNVISFLSTASFKAWIDANEEFIHQMDRSGQIRFISDNARWEGTTADASDKFLNPFAGMSVLRYLRGRQYRAPVLIFCGGSIKNTRYVLSYERAGSTTSPSVCLSYIRALAKGKDNDHGWEGFNV